MIFITESVP